MTETTDVNLTITGVIESLHLAPDDRIIVTLDDQHVPPGFAEKLAKALRDEFPNHTVILLANGIRITRETSS